MTLLLINNKSNKSLELYFIKYIFNTKNFDYPKLKKIDDQKLKIDMSSAGLKSNFVEDDSNLDGSYNSADGPLLDNRK